MALLGRWCFIQKRHYKFGMLLIRKRKKLEASGWNVVDQEQNNMYAVASVSNQPDKIITNLSCDIHELAFA